MRRKISCFLFMLCVVCVHGQKTSILVDEMTAHHLRQLPEEKRSHFDSILQNSMRKNWLSRADERSFDVAFIEEEFCEKMHSVTTTEYYFNRGDSIPAYLYEQGEMVEVKNRYGFPVTWYYQHVIHYQTFQPLFETYSKFQPMQELAYEKEQILDYSCIGRAKDQDKRFEDQRTAELKTTYRINTMIDKKSNTILVSVQYAPEKPKFEIKGYSSAWDW
ncbi:hypothetical protein [Fluviicola sp.]|uniref:hypothetical protein n=1 Tax=Fluviicola sp. TaxID=1917219 RepID=UPI0031D119CC